MPGFLEKDRWYESDSRGRLNKIFASTRHLTLANTWRQIPIQVRVGGWGLTIHRSCDSFEVLGQPVNFAILRADFTRDGAGDLEDKKQGDGVATTTANKTSLRSALLENRYRPPWATDEVLTIKFNLPATKKTITPASLFLEPEWPFILDGTTETDYTGNTSNFSDGLNHNPIVTIEGESAIINLKAGNSEIKGMDIYSVTAQGNNNKITNSIIQNLTVEGKKNTIGIKDSGPNLIYKNIMPVIMQKQ